LTAGSLKRHVTFFDLAKSIEVEDQPLGDFARTFPKDIAN